MCAHVCKITEHLFMQAIVVFVYVFKLKAEILLFYRFLEAAENGDIGKNGVFTIEEASTKLGILNSKVIGSVVYMMYYRYQ